MPARLKDVAQRAGVSIKTVSNVVHGYAHVLPQTRERVERAIKELNYRPNLSARSLRAARSGVIALAVPELDVPYFAELSRHIVAAAEERGWTVLIDQTGGSRERERVVATGIRSELIDGLIFSPLALTGDDLAARTDTTPMVLLGERTSGSRITDHILVDNVTAARDVTAHLIARGRRRIAAIGAQHTPAGVTARLRQCGYAQALEEAGLHIDPVLVRQTPNYHRQDGAQAMRALLDSGAEPDAVFCFNDLLALGAMRTLLQAGYRVPEDIALAGFDGIEEGRYSTPTLTSVTPDKPAIARLAVELLAERLDGAESDARTLYAGYDLAVGESTGGRGE